MRPWEADLIEADLYDRIVLLRRWLREETDTARIEIKDRNEDA